MTDNLTPSDLIYLYLDGETDSMQQTTMFAALATDSDLQQEFNEALSMRKAFAKERTSAKPPLYLTTRVFRDAGIIPTALGAGAAGGAVWMWLRRMTIPVGALLVGSVITFFGMQKFYQNSEQQPIQIVKNEIQPKGNPEPVRVQVPSFAKEEAVQLPRQRVYTSRKTNTSDQLDNPSETDAPFSTTSSPEEDLRPFTQERNTLSLVEATSSSFGRRSIQMVNVSSSFYNPKGKASDWTLEVNRLASINLYGAVPGQNAVNIGNNLSASILYNSNENSSFLANVGYSQYNVSAVTSSGVTQNPSYYALTVGYKHTLTDFDILGGEPFAILGAGLGFNSTDINPVFNTTLGLSFPVWIARFNTGIEYRALRYNSTSGAQLSSNVGFVAGLGFNF